MSTFPSHVTILTQHRPYGLDCACGRPINSDADWARHVDQVWREACTVETVEQLDELPIGSIILSLGKSDIGDIYVNWADHHLADLFGPWFRTGYEVPCPSDEVDLPALLISHPEWSDQ